MLSSFLWMSLSLGHPPPTFHLPSRLRRSQRERDNIFSQRFSTKSIFCKCLHSQRQNTLCFYIHYSSGYLFFFFTVICSSCMWAINLWFILEIDRFWELGLCFLRYALSIAKPYWLQMRFPWACLEMLTQSVVTNFSHKFLWN